METIFKTDKGQIIQGDNLEVMKTFKDESFDNCISDIPYGLEFMQKNWDSFKNWNNGEGKHGTFEGTGYTGKRRPAFYTATKEDKLAFYDWNYERAVELYRIIKKGGYVLIFGHHKTNHRMKCAFEDAGFQIVEEIDWIYGSGMPKNQDIGKLFTKKGNTELANTYSGYKTSGLKPAKEIITVFQKPIDKNYCNNIEKYGCGAMNIDACRIKTKEIITNHSRSLEASKSKGIYHDSKEQETHQTDGQKLGRFPSNIILDDSIGEVLDSQSGYLKSGIMKAGTQRKNTNYAQCQTGLGNTISSDTYGDEGGASRYFLNINFEEDDFIPFLYCPKPTKKEKGTDNKHITVKPKKLIKWLIKLVTPINGKTLDITAGSCTHGLCCEELNREEGYNIEWTNIELFNDEENPYCNIGKERINTYINSI